MNVFPGEGTCVLPVLHNHCSTQIGFLRMAKVVFLLLTLALPLLHLAQATTCQGENCPTGEFYLGLNQQNHGLLPKHNSDWFNENTKLLFVFCTAFLLQVSSSAEDLELKQALKLSRMLHAPFLHFLAKVTPHPFILLPRETRPLPLCPRPRAAACGVRWVVHQDFLHLLAQWAR